MGLKRQTKVCQSVCQAVAQRSVNQSIAMQTVRKQTAVNSYGYIDYSSPSANSNASKKFTADFNHVPSSLLVSKTVPNGIT